MSIKKNQQKVLKISGWCFMLTSVILLLIHHIINPELTLQEIGKEIWLAFLWFMTGAFMIVLKHSYEKN